MINKTIGSLAEIGVGLVLRRKQADLESGSKHLYESLTLKSFNPQGWIEKEYLDSFESSEILEDRYLSVKGDVIIKLTPPYTAVAITDDTSGYVVPSQFIIIRISDKDLNSEYLALYLNSEKTKKHILITATGMTVPMIKTGTLKNFEVPILSASRQEKISEISRLIIKERHLLDKMVSEKEKYYQALTEAIIKEKEEND